VLVRLGRFAEALVAIERAIEIDPGSYDIHRNRADVLLGLGRWREALEDIERWAGSRPGVRAIPEYWGMRACALVNLGETDEALRSYEKALSMAPRCAPCHAGKALVLLRQERFEEAVAAADRTIEIDPAHAGAWNTRGSALDRLGKHAEALATFEKAVALAPRDPGVHYNRALMLGRLERHEECLRPLDRVLALAPDLCRAHKLRAEVLTKLGRLRDAVASWSRVIELDATLLEAHFGRGWCLRVVGRPGEALVDFDEALRLRPPPMEAAQAHCGRAHCLLALGRYEDAVAAEDETDRLFPAHAALCAIRGQALLHLGRVGEARKVADRLGGNRASLVSLKLSILRRAGTTEETRRLARAHLGEDPKTFGHVFLAILCAHAGEAEKAREHLRAAEPSDLPGEAFNRACAHALLGDTDEAIRWLERGFEAGLRLAPNAPPDPDFTDLENDPRYRAVMEKLRRPR
jgi:tetratricopeptide (TPR) repeat protein